MRRLLLVVAGALVVCAGGYYGWQFLAGRRAGQSPEELARAALNPAAQPQDRELAAVQLGQGGRAGRQHTLRVLRESDLPEVRAAAALAIGQTWDYYAMEDLFRARDDDSPLVRAQANATLVHLLKFDYGFRPDESKQDRAKVIGQWRYYWADFRRGELTRQFMRERLGEEFRDPAPAGDGTAAPGAKEQKP